MKLLYPETLSDGPKFLHSENQILLDACKGCNDFDDINVLKDILPPAFVVKLIVISPVSSTSSECYFSRLKLIYNHLRTTMSDKRLDSLFVLFSNRDIVDKINIAQPR